MTRQSLMPESCSLDCEEVTIYYEFGYASIDIMRAVSSCQQICGISTYIFLSIIYVRLIRNLLFNHWWLDSRLSNDSDELCLFLSKHILFQLFVINQIKLLIMFLMICWNLFNWQTL